MKYLKYFLISLVLLVIPVGALACWGPWYTPKGYYMYRVYKNMPEPTWDIEEQHPDKETNCKEWQKHTSETIPLEDIYQAVYKMELEKLEAIYDKRETVHNNKFIAWITEKDTAILDFLLLAKTNEHIRLKRNSRWYYPSMKTGARMTLEEVAERAISTKGSKLRDRYLLQAVRALFSLCKYEKCIELWENEISHWPEDNLMRQLVHPYIAGAEFHTNHPEKAIEYFAQIGDVQSMLYCLGRSGEKLTVIDALEFVCEYAPNSKFIEETLQSYVRSIEPHGQFYWEEEFEKTPDFEKLYNLCLKMARSNGCNNPAMWYYTAAFLDDLSGNASSASRLLGLAEKSKSTGYINESIRVFRMYLDAKLYPYDSNYENRLFAQLKWLDSKIQANIDDKVSHETSRGYMLANCESYYYWNDMMRRILLAEVCPRMIRSGKTTRALQLANMADNRLLNLVNRHEVYDWMDNKVLHYYTMASYRYSSNFNDHDYSNHFFEMIDSLGVNAAIKYVQRVKKPQGEFDRFLNNCSYIGDDYLNDILGTQCLRNMRYREAVEYLGAVSESYKNHHNVYMTHDPFSFGPKKIQIKSDFRYDFAREMYSLEQGLNLTKEPNRKALLMVKYATGIRNSFDRCWGLTQYYRGSNYWGQVCEKRDWENEELTLQALDKAEKTIKLACEIVTDDEIAADIHYELCHFKTIAQMYPNTQKGALVKGKCDNLVDYTYQRRIGYSYF